MSFCSPLSDPKKDITESINKPKPKSIDIVGDKFEQKSSNKIETLKDRPSTHSKNKTELPKQKNDQEPRNKIEPVKPTWYTELKNKISHPNIKSREKITEKFKSNDPSVLKERFYIKPEYMRDICKKIINIDPKINSYRGIGKVLGIDSKIYKVLQGNLGLNKKTFDELQKLAKCKILYKTKLETHKRQERYFKDPLEINLESFTNSIVNKWIKSAKKHQKQLKLDIGHNYITLKNKKMIEVYLNRGYYNFTGVVYRIIEKGTGKMRYGATRDTIETRWDWYKKVALRNKNNSNILPIYRSILNKMRMGISIDREFIIRPVDICFDVNTLAIRENYWIVRHNTQNPIKGYNVKGGGVGIKLDVPIHEIAKFIAKGYNYNRMREQIYIKHKLKISMKTRGRRVDQYWGSKEKARKKFLKPVLEKLISMGYNSNDITNAFGIHGRNVIDRMIPRLFNNSSFSVVRRKHLINTIKPLILNGLGPVALNERLNLFGQKEIENAIKEEWGSLNEAQKILWKPIIINKIKNGELPLKILLDLGYSENTAKSQYNRVLKRLFKGMTYQELKINLEIL
jgi:hypothetical protein